MEPKKPRGKAETKPPSGGKSSKAAEKAARTEPDNQEFLKAGFNDESQVKIFGAGILDYRL